MRYYQIIKKQKQKKCTISPNDASRHHLSYQHGSETVTVVLVEVKGVAVD